MCTVGQTRTTKKLKECPNHTAVMCDQQQVCTTNGWVLKLITWWKDVGQMACPPCPAGPQPRDTEVIVRCFVSAYVVTIEPLPAPGPIWLLPKKLSSLFGPMPEGTVIHPICVNCIGLNADFCEKLLENMKRALEIMNSGVGSRNQVQDQQKAIECLEDACRRLGW